MITRFDHIVIGVQNIEKSLEAYSDLGFEVVEGGHHPSIGTRNAIVRFGLDYLELLAVENVRQARNSGSFGSELVDFLSKSSGFVGFVLASSKIEDEATNLENAGLEYNGPFAMDRLRPDGKLLAWQLVVPGSSPWRKPWPFLIQWETADQDRLTWDPVGNHKNDSIGALGIDLIVKDLISARLFYEQTLGLNVSRIHNNENQNIAITYEIGDFNLNVKLPSDEIEQVELETYGPGPYRLILRTKSLNAKVRYSGSSDQLLLFELDQNTSLGARISLAIE